MENTVISLPTSAWAFVGIVKGKKHGGYFPFFLPLLLTTFFFLASPDTRKIVCITFLMMLMMQNFLVLRR